MKLNEQHRKQWLDDGYVLLEGFYSNQQIDQINGLVDQLWKKRKSLGPEYVIDVFIGKDNEQRVYFSDAPKEARYAPYKLNDLFLTREEIRNMIAGEKLAPILRELLQGFPMVCNTLTFEFGSQQPFHFDTFYMPSPTQDKMIASWIALEDATDQNGPLAYYPGSHKIPPYLFSNGRTLAIPEEMDDFRSYMDEQIAKFELEPQTLLAKKGDVLIWHSQLYHGGSEILDKSKTRKSLVTHYFTTEDFPETEAPRITENSSYMQRAAQPTGYPYAKKSWWQRTFG